MGPLSGTTDRTAICRTDRGCWPGSPLAGRPYSTGRADLGNLHTAGATAMAGGESATTAASAVRARDEDDSRDLQVGRAGVYGDCGKEVTSGLWLVTSFYFSTTLISV